MHTLWKGSVSFGLVNIPIKMFAATENKDIKFRYLHKACNTPIKYEKTCPTCNKEIGEEEIVRGYEYEPGRFVIMDETDFSSLKTSVHSRSIEILDFVKLEEIDPIYFDKSYYLGPGDNGLNAYNLLRKVMLDTKKIAIAKVTIRNKQSLAALRVYKNALIMETIFYPDEIRGVEMVPGLPEQLDVNEKELDIATKLVDNLTEEFNPKKYTDDYREALFNLIHKKIEGKEIEIAPEAPNVNVIDLMEALKASVKETSKPPAKPKKKAASNRKTG